MPSLRLIPIVLLMLASAAQAYDNGPQVIGCDYRFGKKEGVDRCLIAGSGMNQGVSWVVFELQGQRYRYEDDAPDQLTLITGEGKTVATRKVRNHKASCRAGAREADVYQFENGDRICLYWP